MDNYSFEIDEKSYELFFSPIREKRHVILLLMNSIKYMLIDNQLEKNLIKGKMILNKTEKETRLFFQDVNKLYSISFPFTFKIQDEEFKFTYNKMPIDSRVTSDIKGLFSCEDKFVACSPEDFIDSVFEFEDHQYIYEIWGLTKFLMLHEDGYIRYDYDTDNEDGKLHPLNHYDIFYTNNATFKLGLHHITNIDNFIDLLNKSTNCNYIER